MVFRNLVVSFFIMMNLSGNLFANDVPVDVQQLLSRWSGLPKSAAFQNAPEGSYLMVSAVLVNEDLKTHKAQLFKTEFDRLTADSAPSIEELVFEEVSEETRDRLLRSLFAVQGLPHFCNGFDLSVKDEPADQPSEVRLAQSLRSCKSLAKKMLAGIFHAEPTIFFLRVRFFNQSEAVVFYVRSLIDPQHYARYMLRLRS